MKDCTPFVYDYLKEDCVSFCETGYFIKNDKKICDKCPNKYNEGCSFCDIN